MLYCIYKSIVLLCILFMYHTTLSNIETVETYFVSKILLQWRALTHLQTIRSKYWRKFVTSECHTKTCGSIRLTTFWLDHPWKCRREVESCSVRASVLLIYPTCAMRLFFYWYPLETKLRRFKVLKPQGPGLNCVFVTN